MQKSLFITFEGPDGGGKTTQIRLLAEYLRTSGQTVISGREPGGTAIGDQVREILHALKNAEMDFRTEFLLYSASRAQVVHQVIRPALDAGGIVLFDRYIDSTFAYQGYGRGLDLSALHQITQFATGGLLPNATFYLDIDPEAALKRRQEAANQGAEWTRMDAQALDFHKRVRAGYEHLIEAEPERWIRIKAEQSVEGVQAEIRAKIASLLL